MHSKRRARLAFYGTVVFVVCVFILMLQHRRAGDINQDFWTKTVNGLEQRPGGPVGDVASAQAAAAAVAAGARQDGTFQKDAGVQERLQAAEKRAKALANAKSLKPESPAEVVGKGNAAGSYIDSKKNADAQKGLGVAIGDPEAELEDHKVELEMNVILKKSPIIIFSKTTCPHSKKAKEILLNQYTIEPTPYVVELDQHALGRQIQASLAKLTNRHTVPNILINGVSVGGGDEIKALHMSGSLIAKVKDLGGRKMVQVALNSE